MGEDHDEKLAQEWCDRKTSHMEKILGKEHDMVGHAIIPYAIGGALDLYYYPNGIPGTAIATKELCEMPDEGSTNDVFELYELVMFTRHDLCMDDWRDDATPFGKAHSNINRILNLIARYSAEATLNPYETCEFPEEMERVGGKCLIFDAYGRGPEARAPFGLLAVIEIFPSEMQFARKHGGGKLLSRLKRANHYPYSDLDREPVA